MALVDVTARAVRMVNTIRRRCGASTHTPTTGASTAMVNPATASERPSQLAGDVPPDMPAPTLPVR
jgi:hypothetical protein